MTDIPTTIRIGFHDFEVVALEEPKRVLGDIEPDLGRIRLDLDRPAALLAETTLHEVLHGAWAMGGLPAKADEELAVTILSKQLAQVIRDNPDLIAYLQDALAPSPL